jgi:DNA repair exonuclease SbcCD ATPase subunit
MREVVREMSAKVTAALVVFAVIVGGIVGYVVGLNEGSRPVPMLTEENRRLSDELASLTKSVSDLKSERDEISRRYEALRNGVSELERSVNSLTQENSELRNSLSDLRTKVERARTVIQKLEKAVPVYNQISGRDNILSILFRDLQLQQFQNLTLFKRQLVSYWEGIKSSVAEYDPALTPSVDRVINSIDGVIDYINWLLQAPGESASAEELMRWLQRYPQSFDAYQNNVLRFLDEFMVSVSSQIVALRDVSP